MPNKVMRIKRICSALEEYTASCAVILNPPDIFYLTGLNTMGVLVVKPGEELLYVSSVNFEEVKKDTETAGSELKCIEFKSGIPWDGISSELKGMKVVMDEDTPLKVFNEVKNKFDNIVFVGDLVAKHRVIKDPDEQEAIRKACNLTAGIFAGIDVNKWIGKTERELAAHLEKLAWQNSGSGRAFAPVVAAGKNSAYPHHIPSNDSIGPGLLTIDYGIIYDGYCSDLTRTYILDKFINNIDAEKLYMHLYDARRKAVELLRPGMKCSEVYEAARRHLKEFGIDKYFIHGLGHGLGIEVHERPYLRPSEHQLLEEGMVVTVEPGIYMPGLGGMRVEDTFLIVKEGAEQLTRIFQ